ncbi:uncharacterized protein [Typha latifolia]|uniref:uncharacterized protein isoform X3 n=1 Tax=Typha latifolia TaxID=4733 RepID=UPI003C2B65C0
MEVYFVFMNFDPVYERLQGNSKHDKLLAELLQPNTYRKRSSLAIVDGFAVEITREQAAILRSAKEVRLVEKNQEFA